MRKIILSLLLLISFNSFGDNVVIANRKVDTFIQSILPDARIISNECDIPLELILAQACLETGYGTSRLCKQKCNYMGIKKGSNYETYSSLSACFAKYSQVLNQSCYKGLQPDSLDDWINSLESCHYASSKNYRWKIKWIINKFGLKLL